MKVFQTTRKYFAILGIYLAEINQDRTPNIRNAIALITLVLTNILSTTYLLYESKSFGESASAIYIVLSVTNLSFNLLAQISNATHLFQFIQHFEDIIEKSENLVTSFNFVK